MSAQRSAIAVFIAERPIDWDGTPVTTVALLAFSEESRDDFGEIYNSFIHALVNPKKVALLHDSATNFDALVQALITVL